MLKVQKVQKLPLQLIFNPQRPKKIMRLPLDQKNFRLCSVKIPCFAISSLPVSVPRVPLRSGFSDTCPEPLPNATSGRAVSPLLPPRMAVPVNRSGIDPEINSFWWLIFDDA